MAREKVRYVGEPIAFIVAESVGQAKEAAELIELDVESLPAVTDARAAAAPGAPLVHDDAPGNMLLDFHYGDAKAVADAFAKAKHVVKLSLPSNRVVVAAMEPRAAIGRFEDGRYIINVGSQGAFGMRASIAGVMGCKPEQIRVLTGNVGGSFGMKALAYPEYICALFAAKTLGRPVKWTDERTDSFMSDSHGRDHDMTGELALDADGVILALRVEGYANLGAYAGMPIQPTNNLVKNVIGVYRTPLMDITSRVMVTNTTPVGAYRGAGRPEGNYYIERMLDNAAIDMKIDKLEIRRRNHIQPQAMPYKAPSGMEYDSGEFTALLDKAIAGADWDGYEQRKRDSKARGRLRGRGVGSYLEVTAPPNSEMGGIRFDEDGGVTIITGTLDYGQGHASSFAQILGAQLGIPFDRVRLLQGDSDQLVAGGGTGGSRSAITTGKALLEASQQIIERGLQVASFMLEAAKEDIEFVRGRFVVAGTDRAIDVIEMARRMRTMTLPPELPKSLDVSHVSKDPPSAFPNGCHVAEVEIDPDTGVVEVVKYSMVNDFGTAINPMLVEGQAHGGIVQGIGQALLERTYYDEQGQFLTGSFTDYALPRATDAPMFKIGSHPVPAKTNPLGIKGCGEAGCAGALPSVMNAVVDALSVYGVRNIDMPATPEKVWLAIQDALRAA